jgi:hypothetical protein
MNADVHGNFAGTSATRMTRWPDGSKHDEIRVYRRSSAVEISCFRWGGSGFVTIDAQSGLKRLASIREPAILLTCFGIAMIARQRNPYLWFFWLLPNESLRRRSRFQAQAYWLIARSHLA